MRVLVLDDQKDIFDSVRPILNVARFKSYYASNVEDAQRLVRLQTFDLVLVDLQMPPGNWGGLEAIKQLRALDNELPLVVLSGKGTLVECIEAIRLGALDYIQKESFEIDFRHRILPLYWRPYAIGSYPSLLAYLYRVYQEESALYLKAKKMIDLYEFSIRLLTLVILSEAGDMSSKDKISSASDSGLGRASLGTYVSFLFEQISGHSEGHFIDAIRDSDLKECRQLCDLLTKCRNEHFGHSVTITATQAEKILESMNEPVTRFLNALSFLRRFNFYLVESLEFDGTMFSAHVKMLRGDNLLHASAVVKTHRPVKTGEVVIFDSHSFVAGLDPVVRVHPSGSGDQHAYSLFDKIVGSTVHYSTIPVKN